MLEVSHVLFIQKTLDRPRIKGKIVHHRFDAKLQKNFEENGWIRLIFDKDFNLTLRLAGVYTLEQAKLSQRDLVNFDLENLFKLCESLFVCVLLLNTDLAIVVELKCKQDMVCRLYLKIVALSERVKHSLEAFAIYDDSTSLFTK